MARVENTPRTLTARSLQYIREEIKEAIHNLSQSVEFKRSLEASGSGITQAKIDAIETEFLVAAKNHNANAIKMYRWLFGKISVTVPPAYTDAEVDAIHIDIRTRDDGNP